MRRLLIHTDGAARGNPGPAGAGALIQDAETGETVAEIARFLGERTNNYAEWTAVELALREARDRGATIVDLRTDSELVARQIAGRYKVRHPDLKPIHARVMALLAELDARRPRIERAARSADYRLAFGEIAGLRPPVDRFFTDVFVMVDDERLRTARLKLMSDLRDLILELADISEIIPQTE